MRFHSMLALAFAVTFAAGPAQAAQGRGSAGKAKDAPRIEVVFTRGERDIIRDWFRIRRTDLPPGLAKRDRLPPGLDRQLRKRGTLPPGLEKKDRSLPADLEVRLPRLPTGHRRVILGGHVVLMNDDKGVIQDIIRDVVP